MARRFIKLTRPNIRSLKSGQKLTEHGITAIGLADGDIHYSVNVMVDGQRIHRVIGRESEGVTRTQAEEFIAAKRTEAREGRLSLPKGRKLALTFEGAAGLYLCKLKETGGKDYTKNMQHLRLHLTPYFGKMRLDRISTFTVQKFQRHCREQGLAEATINRILSTYRRMGRRLAEWDEIKTPFPMVRLAEEKIVRTHVLTRAEEESLLNAALSDSNPYIWLFIRLGLSTGLRHDEIISARFDAFDPVRRRLRVRLKGGDEHQQPLTREITNALLQQQAGADDASGFIFPSTRTRHGHVGYMSDAFRRCVERAGLDAEKVIPHTLRHTAHTRFAHLPNVNLKTQKAFTGHKSDKAALRYIHAQDEVIDRALELMETGTTPEHMNEKRGAKR